MSISIGHRAIFTAFGHRTSFAPKTGVTPAAVKQAETPAPAEAGELRCSPWEGLYLEQARPADAADEAISAHRQLDAFLANLMYGE